MLSMPRISDELQREINGELEAGETIKWIEQPLSQFFCKRSVVEMIAGIPFAAIALFLIHEAMEFQDPDLREAIEINYVPALIGILFIMVGLWMLLSPLRQWLKISRTVYLITDRRAISIESTWVVTIRNYMPSQLREMYRKQRRDGTGDVVMMTHRHRDGEGASWTEEIGFMNVRNPREVEKLLQQLAGLRT